MVIPSQLNLLFRRLFGTCRSHTIQEEYYLDNDWVGKSHGHLAHHSPVWQSTSRTCMQTCTTCRYSTPVKELSVYYYIHDILGLDKKKWATDTKATGAEPSPCTYSKWTADVDCTSLVIISGGWGSLDVCLVFWVHQYHLVVVLEPLFAFGSIWLFGTLILSVFSCDLDQVLVVVHVVWFCTDTIVWIMLMRFIWAIFFNVQFGLYG